MDTVGAMLSIGIQYGVPIKAYLNKMRHMKFEPAGITNNADIQMATSIIDYIANWIDKTYFGDAADESSNEVSMLGPSMDGPPCTTCSTIMVRAGGCYRCPQCGSGGACDGA